MTAARPATVAGLSSRAAAEAYVGGVCFKLGPPRLVGVELEWLTDRTDRRCHAARTGLSGRPDAATLARALGRHAPATVQPDSAARPLPAGGQVSIEPGGQIEISSLPVGSATELCDRMASDTQELTRLLAAQSVQMITAAADADRPPLRVLATPRYHAMQEFFDNIGPFGRLMMCNTAAVQIGVDCGADTAELTARWHDAARLGLADEQLRTVAV